MTEQTPNLREQIANLYAERHGFGSIDAVRPPELVDIIYGDADAIVAAVFPEVERLHGLLREANEDGEDGFGWKPRAEVAEAEVKRLRAALLHPEFGSEWREPDGVIYKATKDLIAERDAVQERVKRLTATIERIQTLRLCNTFGCKGRLSAALDPGDTHD